MEAPSDSTKSFPPLVQRGKEEDLALLDPTENLSIGVRFPS